MKTNLPHFTIEFLGQNTQMLEKDRKIKSGKKQSLEYKRPRSSTNAKNQESGSEEEQSPEDQSHHKIGKHMPKAPEAQPPTKR